MIFNLKTGELDKISSDGVCLLLYQKSYFVSIHFLVLKYIFQDIGKPIGNINFFFKHP